jgi:transcriptional regulator with XRE-family HTH domain
LELSDFSGVSPSIISNIENGKSNATINTLEKILNILGLELNIDIKKMRI